VPRRVIQGTPTGPGGPVWGPVLVESDGRLVTFTVDDGSELTFRLLELLRVLVDVSRYGRGMAA
jgi:hypothetical protein